MCDEIPKEIYYYFRVGRFIIISVSQVSAEPSLADLGTLGGNAIEARDINDNEQIVGVSQKGSGEFHPFIWDQGPTVDLCSDSWCGYFS
jgi:probable HAF family extracellular repeat protein